jgi:capsular polysaccharide biosynthesis protein
LHDSLNRLYPWRHLERRDDDRLLVSRTNKVSDFHIHCKAYGFDEKSILECQKEGRFLKIPTLYYGVNPSFYTSFTPDCYAWVKDGYDSLFPAPARRIPGIYLDRNHVKSNARGVENNEEVKDYLRSRGFVVVTGEESLSEIYQLFSSAQCIVGPHGSVFVNTIFCQSDCQIIEYCPSNRPDFSFLHKYKLAQDYTHILVEADSDFNISINISELSNMLDSKA